MLDLIVGVCQDYPIVFVLVSIPFSKSVEQFINQYSLRALQRAAKLLKFYDTLLLN